MTTGRMIEFAAAALILGAGIYFYRRPDPTADKKDNYGAQGAVIMLVVAAILLIHGLGALEYHPSQAEIDAARASGR